MSHLVGSVAHEVLEEDSSSEKTFMYEGKRYMISIDLGFSIRLFLSDIKKIPQYNLKVSDDTERGGKSLEVFYTPFPVDGVSVKSRNRLFDVFFSRKVPENEVATVDIEGEPVSFGILYDKLREAHRTDVLDEKVKENVQHESLAPLLRPYQVDAVKWLLHKEYSRTYLPTDYEEISMKITPCGKFYYNPRTLDIIDRIPENIELPTGGILADEMGLGKTVEMLTLILNNPRVDMPQKEMSDDEDKPLAIFSIRHTDIKCLCGGRIKKRKHIDLIKCCKCSKSQHKCCVIGKNTPPERYICPVCWKSEPPVVSKATFIVSPASIKKQWESEIIRHIRDPNFKVLVYDGTTSGWIDPTVMAQYDVVITDYNVMKSEIYFTSENSRDGTLRHEKKHMNPTSPLPCIQWWRVCLDEAQLVETTTTHCARMVKTLPTVHRWAVTGTPIEKHINNLYGLIFFLDIYPYTDIRMWEQLVKPFTRGDCDPLIDLLRQIMWRTCKSLVFEQIGIPPQQEIVHYITMSDLQTFFYRSQHSLCRFAFIEKAKKIGTTLAMAKMNAHILKLLLEPLRKLRLDCTVPSVNRGNRADQQTIKKFLTPDELHAHLVSNNELEAKAQLRTIASSFNALAGISMIRSDVPEAEKMYKAVLRRAKDYTGTISVDSLLQIHALHNLIEIANVQEQQDPDQKVEYQMELKKLEGKYITSYHTKMKQVEKQLNDASQALETMEADADWNGSWWREVFCSIRGTGVEDGLIEKINQEINLFGGALFSDDLRTTTGIDIKLTIWWDKVIKARREVRKTFEKLSYFTENVDPAKPLLNPSIQEKIDRLIYEAFECHLDVVEKEDEPEAPVKKRKIDHHPCQLCRAKEKLRNLECLIFDKIFLETLNCVRGSWNPSLEEVIVKTILAFVRKERLERINSDFVTDGEAYLEYIEAIKREYKEYSQFWSEIDYTVSAFDELKMCKSRLEGINPDDLDEGDKKTRTQIFMYEIDDAVVEFNEQLQHAEKEFVRIWGVLKYLKHLEKNSGPEVCPICTQIPEEKYYVLECGHHLCMICMVQMRKFHGQYLTCSVCRHKQKFKDTYCVTLTDSKDLQEIRGEWSNKVSEMLKLVLSLKNKDPKVKILIFYHWDTVEPVLRGALLANNVKSVSASGRKFHKTVEMFKDPKLEVTCLLLPLAFGSKGLNLVEATHVILLEPILNPGEELQAIGRVHRIGQTRPTFVHRFIVLGTIEETIYRTISNDQTGKWETKDITVDNLMKLFELPTGEDIMAWDEYIQ